MTIADAPSKLILLGEHAVVYGRPALAVALDRPRSQATVAQASDGRPVSVALENLKVRWNGGDGEPPPQARPFAKIIKSAVESGAPAAGWTLMVRSEIPLGCGLGSGASTAAAAYKAVFLRFGVPLTPQALSDLVYEIEKLHHGAPSGIDNTVIALEAPILFRRGAGAERLSTPESPFSWVVGHTGVRHHTAEVVADVARARSAAPAAYDAAFDEIGDIALRGAEAFQKGLGRELGKLMDRNQELLRRIGVSSPELDSLIRAAQGAGALGAKLSGAGRGGCMAALARDREHARRIEDALKAAGAAATFSAGPREGVRA